MPSERSKPSEMTGEKAARSKVKSISLATCWSPFCTTTNVTGSMWATESLLQRADGDFEVAEGVDADTVARLDDRGGVELLHDGRPRELDTRPQMFAPIDRRVDPFAVEPGAARGDGAWPRASGRDRETRQLNRMPAADDGSAQAHHQAPHPAQLDLEALPVRSLEGHQQLVTLETSAGDGDGEHVRLADVLHVGLVVDRHRLDVDALGGEQAAALLDLAGQDPARLGDVHPE